MVPIDAFRDILVVRSFTSRDPAPLRLALERAWKAFAAADSNLGVRVRFVDVQSEDEMIAALRDYDGPILIFDGHGDHLESLDVGGLHLGGTRVDAWRLRGEVRIPRS
jgi:hypothetical protein